MPLGYENNYQINQRIPVGSEAYNRAMQNLQNNQNDALNQAAYQSVLNGQDAYAQAFADNLRAAQFNNNARQSYIDQIRTLLGNSISGYDNMLIVKMFNKTVMIGPREWHVQSDSDGV